MYNWQGYFRPGWEPLLRFERELVRIPTLVAKNTTRMGRLAPKMSTPPRVYFVLLAFGRSWAMTSAIPGTSGAVGGWWPGQRLISSGFRGFGSMLQTSREREQTRYLLRTSKWDGSPAHGTSAGPSNEHGSA
jgi:hypothetical protein